MNIHIYVYMYRYMHINIHIYKHILYMYEYLFTTYTYIFHLHIYTHAPHQHILSNRLYRLTRNHLRTNISLNRYVKLRIPEARQISKKAQASNTLH